MQPQPTTTRLENSMRHLLHSPWLWRCVFYPLLGFILFLATTPKAYPLPSSANDKINHFIAFVVLSVLLRLAHRHLALQWTLAFLATFGFLIEGVQYLLPYRDFSWMDWLTDLAGIAAGVLLIEGLFRLSANRAN